MTCTTGRSFKTDNLISSVNVLVVETACSMRKIRCLYEGGEAKEEEETKENRLAENTLTLPNTKDERKPPKNQPEKGYSPDLKGEKKNGTKGKGGKTNRDSRGDCNGRHLARPTAARIPDGVREKEEGGPWICQRLSPMITKPKTKIENTNGRAPGS